MTFIETLLPFWKRTLPDALYIGSLLWTNNTEKERWVGKYDVYIMRSEADLAAINNSLVAVGSTVLVFNDDPTSCSRAKQSNHPAGSVSRFLREQYGKGNEP